MSQAFRGYGQEGYGDPVGWGGPIHLVRARAMASHVCRVVFDVEPLHQSSAGKYDATNPANYLLKAADPAGGKGIISTASQGFSGTLNCVGVDKGLIEGPAPAVFTTQWGVDVHTDKPMVTGVIYRVTPINIKARGGGLLGFPPFRDFPGIVNVQNTQPPRQIRSYIDIDNEIAEGAWVIDNSGDMAVEGGLKSLRKRIYRRLITQPGAFAWLPTYGVGIANKENGHRANLDPLKAVIVQQIQREPEVQDVSVQLTLQPEGVLFVAIRATTKAGLTLNLEEQFQGTV